MKKIIIGIVAKHRDVSVDRPDLVLRDEMKDAVFYNDAIAIGILSPTRTISLVDQGNERDYYEKIDRLLSEKEKDALVAQIELCDGLILAGGSKSDAYEIWIAKYCYEHDIPLLAICAGQNNLVRAMGGTTKKLENDEEHFCPKQEFVHSVNVIDKESIFYQMVQEKSLKVNSRHRRVVDNPAGLDVVAVDHEGNIEVVEAKNKLCFIGMRFHPESLYLKDKRHNNIFKQYIQLCKNRVVCYENITY
ncbi:MAG: gamma-glutamyl-gamma-aminobutyrate hydrolase family protein [Clostridia bacterium]|nr:gamma-glutamyl-gamma-aminobutyrate hydrolase family protein [Clostridia bacterium]